MSTEFSYYAEPTRYLVGLLLIIFVLNQRIDKCCNRLRQQDHMFLQVLAIFELVIIIINRTTICFSYTEAKEVSPSFISKRYQLYLHPFLLTWKKIQLILLGFFQVGQCSQPQLYPHFLKVKTFL